MKRGTKEFQEIKSFFEKAVKSGLYGYLPNDFTEDNFGKTTFYANGEVNKAFQYFIAGYSAGRIEYL